MGKLSGCEVSFLATAIANEMARDKTQEEILILKNLTSQVSSVLQVIWSQNLYNQNKKK